MLEVFCQYVYLVADAPVHALYLGSCLEVNKSVGEEVETLLAYLLRIVPILEHRPLVEVVPDVVEVFHELVAVLVRLIFFRHLRK